MRPSPLSSLCQRYGKLRELTRGPLRDQKPKRHSREEWKARYKADAVNFKAKRHARFEKHHLCKQQKAEEAAKLKEENKAGKLSLANAVQEERPIEKEDVVMNDADQAAVEKGEKRNKKGKARAESSPAVVVESNKEFTDADDELLVRKLTGAQLKSWKLDNVFKHLGQIVSFYISPSSRRTRLTYVSSGRRSLGG